MGCSPTAPVLNDCPNCGKERGGHTGNSTWGHRFYCCSEACGRAFRDSSIRWELEVGNAEQALRAAALRLASCESDLAKAMKREHERESL